MITARGGSETQAARFLRSTLRRNVAGGPNHDQPSTKRRAVICTGTQFRQGPPKYPASAGVPYTISRRIDSSDMKARCMHRLDYTGMCV